MARTLISESSPDSSLWKHRDFLRLWAGQVVSEIGSRITREGIPMAAVLMMGVTPFTMSGLSLAAQLPASLFGILIGVWVDHARRRSLMITADILRAILLLSLPVAALTGTLHLWLFFLVAALTGVLSLLFDVSYQAFLPGLIERRNLAEGNSKLSITSSIAEVIGPGLTGMLVQAMTAPIAIVIDSFSYLFSALMIGTIRAKEKHLSDDKRTGDSRNSDGSTSVATDSSTNFGNWRREMLDGLRILRRNRSLFALAGVAATSGFFSSPIFVLDTLYALRTLHLTAFLFGITVTMGGVGALCGAVLCNHVVRRFGVGKTMTGMLVLQGMAASGWVLAGGSVWRIMACLLAWQLFGDLCGTIYGILDSTLRQTLVADELLGRVNATIRVGEVGFTAIGALIAGILGNTVGIRETMIFAVGGMILTTLWIVASPLRTLTRLPS